MLSTILCKLSAPEITAIVAVGLFICSGPVLFYFFGAENGCQKTRWQKLKEKWFGKK